MAYISADGKLYKDFQEYCNSEDLELDDKFRKLLAGSRIPQNDEEKVWLENMRKYSRMCDQPTWADRNAAGGNPCLEQTLESYEMCCLVETFPAHH